MSPSTSLPQGIKFKNGQLLFIAKILYPLFNNILLQQLHNTDLLKDTVSKLISYGTLDFKLDQIACSKDPSVLLLRLSCK